MSQRIRVISDGQLEDIDETTRRLTRNEQQNTTFLQDFTNTMIGILLTRLCSAASVLVVLLGLLHGVRAAALDLNQCDSYVRRTNGVVCYQAMDTPDLWSDAQRVCNARGMSIAEILTPEENNAVTNLLLRNNMVDSWLNAVQSNDTWRWLDGVELSNQGCFVDSSANPDLENITVFEDNSVSKCLSYCRDLSYTYASVEAGVQCHCGNEFGKYGQDGASCGIQCPRTWNETCGGDTSQQVFSIYGAYSNWVAGQPNNANGYQSCATTDSSVNYQWEDVQCRDVYRGICEIPTTSNASCPVTSPDIPAASLVNGRCLMTTTAAMSFFNTRYTCRSYGGDLIMHISKEDTAAISQWLNLPANSTVQFYIGLNKWAWKWQSDNEFLYTNWNDQQPTGPNLNCITIKRDNNPGDWTDISCNSSHLYICQKSNETIKTSAPLFTFAPTTPPRRTAPPPLTLKSVPAVSASTPASAARSSVPPVDAASNSTNSPINVPAIIGGAVAGGIVLLVVVVFVIVVCRRSKSPAPEAEKSPSAPPPVASAPGYFYGVESTPKYRSEPRLYPSLPDFSEKPDNDHESRKNADSMGPEAVPVYGSMKLVPVATSPNTPTTYFSDIYINPELSY